MGGAFGGKESQATIIAGIAAVLAWKTRRPVKLRLPRDDDMRATGKRHPFLIRYDVGFDDDGRILGARPDAGREWRQCRRPHARGGDARALPCRQLLLAAACALPRPLLQDQHGVEHRVPRLRRPAGHVGDRDHHRHRRAASRAAGRHRAAAQLLRHRPQRRHALRHDGRGQHHRARGRRARAHRRHRELARRASTPSTATSPVVKKGLATMPIKFGISFNRPALNQAGALVHVYTDGSVVLNHGGTEMGQGLFVKVAQVVAETFQHRPRPHPRLGDLDRQGAEHLADRGLLRLRPQRHGGAQRRRADQGPA